MGWAEEHHMRAYLARQVKEFVLDEYAQWAANLVWHEDPDSVARAVELAALALHLERYAVDMDDQVERFEGMGEPKVEG